VGIGGHINPVDAAQDALGETMYYNGVEREIAEELRLGGTHTQRVIGLINDDATEVGSVHLGVVHLFDLSADDVASNEDAIQDLRFHTLEELKEMRDQLETWSQICLDHLWSLRRH
jgi:predicted NUDIX family phosphoesterase